MKDKLKATDVVVVIFHDHGSRYLAKIFNDDWMREKGYLDKKGMTASDLVSSRKDAGLMTIASTATIAQALKIITEKNFSQVPVTRDSRIVGTVTEQLVYEKILANPEIKTQPVATIMQEAIPFVDSTTSLDALSKMLANGKDAVLVKDFKADRNYIITKQDLVEAMM
jgi:cystathionine beta-synthase